MKHLHRDFYSRNTHIVAKGLLGKILVRTYRNKKLTARITETESYVGEDDLACHASKGRTGRTEIMYGNAGHAYVYLIYGMYNMFNVVTEEKNFPAAVLVRGATHINFSSPDKGKLDGPGRVTRALHIDRSLNGEDITKRNQLYIADDGLVVSRGAIKNSTRIGVDYAGEHALLPWRYYIA